ncbi:MAG: rane protein [Polyangiaceae bacterium]|jgi:integral membrane protein|nr:rane protein [Polyangiaceae bacterium]
MRVKSLGQFRVVAYLEGISYLLLLGVAMPLKYLADLPLAVRVMGSVHGALFVAFVVTLVRAAWARRWPISRPTWMFATSLVPFGMVVLDRAVRRELDAAPAAR